MTDLPRRSFLTAAGALAALPAWAGDLWTPMSIDHGMIISARVNGRLNPIVLDSGASGDGLMDTSTANRLGLKLNGSFPVGGWVGKAQGQRAEPITVRLGGETLSLALAVVDFRNGVQEPPIILGRSVFAGRDLDFDFPNRRVALRPRGYAAPGSLSRVKSNRHGDRLMPVQAAGRTLSTEIDLGDSDGLSMSAKLADQLGLLKGRRWSTWVALAVDGPYSYRVTTLDHVKVAGVDLPGLPVSILDTWIHDQDAILGLQAFGRFRMVCDFDDDKVWFQPDAAALAKPFDKDLGGLAFVPDAGRLKVFHVAANSPAAAAGWKTGEMVAGIDIPGPLNGMTRLRGPVGRVVTLTMADGSSRQVTLSEYY